LITRRLEAKFGFKPKGGWKLLKGPRDKTNFAVCALTTRECVGMEERSLLDKIMFPVNQTKVLETLL